MLQNASDCLEENRLAGVIRAVPAVQALEAGKAAIAGGIMFIEIDFSIPGAGEVMRELQKNRLAVVGAGNILNEEQAEEACLEGAQFISIPGVCGSISRFCMANEIFLLGGGMTPTEILNSSKDGSVFQKVYPAGTAGGPQYIRTLKETFPFLNLLPSGGVTLKNMVEYFQNGASAVSLGTGLFDKRDMETGNYDLIRERSVRFIERLKHSREGLPV